MGTRKVDYNRQTDNKDFKLLHPYQQCFSTSAWMLLGYLCPDMYNGSDDEGLARYIADVSNHVGDPGIGEEVLKQNNIDASKESSYYWVVQKAAIEKYLAAGGRNGKVVFMDGNCTWENLIKAIKICPVILGTYKMAGLPGGHIILAVDVDEDENLICHDPFGDANTGYKNRDGSYVVYRKDWIKPFIGGETKIRTLWYY